jgi:hypothetical protein
MRVSASDSASSSRSLLNWRVVFSVATRGRQRSTLTQAGWSAGRKRRRKISEKGSAGAAASLKRKLDARRGARSGFLVHDTLARGPRESAHGFRYTLLGELLIPAGESGACFLHRRTHGLPDAPVPLGTHDTLSISFFRRRVIGHRQILIL